MQNLFLNSAKILANFVRIIETMHNETSMNVVPFLLPIFTLPEYGCFKYIAENNDDKHITESYAIFLRLIDDLNIEVKD